MNDFDENMKEALHHPSGFDPERTRAAQRNVYQTYNTKQKWSERAILLMNCLFIAAGIYALWGFVLQASTTKGWIGYGMVIMWAVLITIQINILGAISAVKLLTLKEVKQLHLALRSGEAPQDESYAKPLRGISPLERVLWTVVAGAMVVVAGVLGTQTNRQDDLWRIKAQNQVEAHNVLTLGRFPHTTNSLYGVTGPVEGAVLQSATFNGRPVAFDRYKNEYAIKLPYRQGWTNDKIELVWNFSLPPMEDYREFRAALRSYLPVHGYSLTLHVEEGSGFNPRGDSWKFNKSSKELANAAEAQRTVKSFTQQIRAASPQKEFGTCGLAIVASPK